MNLERRSRSDPQINADSQGEGERGGIINVCQIWRVHDSFWRLLSQQVLSLRGHHYCVSAAARKLGFPAGLVREYQLNYYAIPVDIQRC